MIQDDEFEFLVTTPKRIEALGFKPQKEILTNHLLPYADELDEESTRFLEQVKTNLAKAVMLREMKPACGVWSSRLMKYIRIHGLKFAKEDHIALIKLAYELMLIPDLEPCKVHKFATMFVMLTKKRQLISPDDLTLPWRPLYDLGTIIFVKSSTSIGMYHYLTPKRSGKQGEGILDLIRKFLSGDGLGAVLDLFGLPGADNDDDDMPTSLEGSYISMVKCARPYFGLNATKEILEVILPQINPWNSDTHTVCQLAVFLPVALPTKHADKGHLLWFDELMTMWDTWYNAQCGISELMIVFSGLAKRNPGAVDWSPYVPKMFVRFLHALNLPVSYKDMQITRSHSLDMKNVASWIVWAINPDGVVLKQLRSFLAGVESYLHSANAGRWSYKLRDLLRKLAREFLNRVRREREKRYTGSWENKVPKAYKLSDEDITEFVNIVLEPTLQAVYSRSGSLDISIALHNLATLRPATVIPPLLERLRTSLTSLTEPHRVTAAMSAVAAVARPLLRGPDADYPEGPTHVVPLLMAVLPGLDPNDIKKTIVTLHFILIFSWMVPFIDCSKAHEYWDDLTEEELLTCESTAQMEDFVLVFMDRLFVIIESSVLEHVRLDTKESDFGRSKTDIVMETAISSAATALLIQCSPKIFREVLRKFKAFATETTFETNVSGSMVGVLLRVFARINSEATLAAFLPNLCEELSDILSSDEILTEDNPPRALMYRLVLLLHVVECDGTALLKYIPNILPVLDRALKLRNRQAQSRACDTLSHMLSSLSFVDLKEWRSSPKDYGEAPEKWLPIREWGSGCLLQDVDLKWHVPSDEEAACAQMLVDRYLKTEISRLRQWLSGERDMCRERRLRSFHVINATLSCSTFYPPPPEEPITLLESNVPATSIPFTSGVKHEVHLDGENVRVALTKLLLEVQARLIADRSDDTRGLEMLITVWERVVASKGVHGIPPLEARLRAYAALERALDGRGGPTNGRGEEGSKDAGAARLRMLTADAARLHDDARYDLACEAGITPSVLKALHAFAELSVNTYSSVRILAQIRLYWMLSHYPYSYRALVPSLAAQLAEEGLSEDEWHAKHKGVLFIMLGPRAGPLVAKQDWEVARVLWPAILKAPLSEKPCMVRLEQAFGDVLHRQFPTVNTKLTVSTKAVEAASRLLTAEQISDPQFVELLNGAIEREVATSNKTESVYLELMNELVDIIETPNIQWRRLELAMQMMTFCPSLQTLYPPNAVRACVRALLHDDIVVRRTALRLTHYILKQRKHKVIKVPADPYEIAGVPKPEKHIPGYRKDLEWAIWFEDNVPKTDEEWEKPWLRNPMYGFYAWPEKIEVALPSSQQTFSSDIQPEDMEEGERFIHEFFTDADNVDKLVGFLTVEEKKGKDKFNGIRFSVFKLLFSQFGEQVADRFIAHALRCAKAVDSQEALQRFASEIAAAVIRAPRFWPRVRAINMYNHATDIIEIGLGAVTAETLDDWGTSLATGVEKLDPRRGASFLQALLRLCAPQAAVDTVPDNDTSFSVCARLYALQGALGTLKWRAAPLAAVVLQRLEDANFIQHPYQNVRETVGSLLMTIFDTEVLFPGGDTGGAPNLAEFLASVLPRLAVLYDENGDIVIKTAVSAAAAMQCSAREDSAECAGTPTRALLAPVPQVGQLVDVARLAPGEAHVDDDAPQAPETGESDTEGATVVTSRIEKDLGAQLESALRLAGDTAPPAPQDHARALNLLTTVLRGTMGVIVRGVQNSAVASYALVRAACGVAARGPPQPHDELPRAAAGFLASLALALHAPLAFHAALAHLDALAGSRSWWARLACLDFALPLVFYGLPLLCDEADKAVQTEKFALKLMRDQRLEVRQTAAKLLTGLMHCRALPNECHTIRSLMRSCRSKELVERHFGVLGLCAYLASRPYSLGSHLGDVLAELARHTSAPDPIPATIRSSLADFRRTHQDDWPKHREQLTEEELDLLADLTSPPSYCA